MIGVAILPAVHLGDVLSPWGWIPTTIAALLLVTLSAFRLRDEDIPRLGVFTAAVFVASQIHIPAGISSVHLLLNAITGIVLGWRAPLAIGIAVFNQALLFAHGGLTTWGANTLTLSLPALAAGVSFRRLHHVWPRRTFVLGFGIGLLTASITVVMACAILYVTGISSWAVIGIVAGSHLPVIGLEAMITATLARYFSRTVPDWLK